MTNTSVSLNRGTPGEFRVGQVFDRAFSVYTRNFLNFSLVALIASAPPLLLTASMGRSADTGVDFAGTGVFLLVFTIFLTVVLGLLSQAILVYGSFQDMRGKPVDLTESFNVVLNRLLPILGLTILTVLGFMIGFMLLIIPGLILLTRWFVAVPACVVERRSPLDSLKRSSELTKGNRWKVFGIILLLYIGAAIVSQIITLSLTAIGGSTLGLIATLIWNTIWGAFFAVFVVVTYYELRAAKEGVDIEQIASVFD